MKPCVVSHIVLKQTLRELKLIKLIKLIKIWTLYSVFQNPIWMSTVPFCMLNSKFRKLKLFYSVLFLRVKRDPPVGNFLNLLNDSHVSPKTSWRRLFSTGLSALVLVSKEMPMFVSLFFSGYTSLHVSMSCPRVSWDDRVLQKNWRRKTLSQEVGTHEWTQPSETHPKVDPG